MGNLEAFVSSFKTQSSTRLCSLSAYKGILVHNSCDEGAMGRSEE